MGQAGRDARVEVGFAVAEQVQRLGHQLRGRRRAAGRRRLQGRGGQAALAPALDRDIRLVQGQRIDAVAELARQRGAEGDGGVAAERHLGLGREVTDPESIAAARGERGFGEAHGMRQALHLGLRRQRRADPDAGRIPALPPSEKAAMRSTSVIEFMGAPRTVEKKNMIMPRCKHCWRLDGAVSPAYS
jgi:hypothetical protein